MRILNYELLIDTDVLVIGGGAAAIRAAIEADSEGAKVLMVIKGILGRSGSTFYPISPGWGMQAALRHEDPLDSPEQHYEDIIAAGLGMVDERLARIVAEEAPQCALDLERFGLRFDRVDDKFVQVMGCFSSRKRCLQATGIDKIREALTKEIKRRRIKVIEKVMVIDLLSIDGEVVGAIGLDETGSLLVFKAKSTILASGGGGNLFKHNLNTPEITGDGYYLALKAGAELANMEFFQIGMGIVHPVKKGLFLDRLFRYYPLLYNRDKHPFVKNYLPGNVTPEECFNQRATHFPFSTRDNSKYIDIAIFQEIVEGRGTQEDGIYVDFGGIPREAIENYPLNKIWYNWLLSEGIDIFKTPLQINLHAHAFNGGVRINERAETRIPGFYAAGEVISGPHGADRIGGGMMAATQVFGTRVGRYAAERAKKLTRVKVPEEEIKYNWERLEKIKEGKEISIAEIRMRLHETMWRHVLINRHEEGLMQCLSNLKEIKEELPKIRVGNIVDLKEALSIYNMVMVGEVMAKAALRRRESRGSHHRKDYPLQDDLNFSKSIIVQKEDNELKFRMEKLSK